MTDGVQLVAFGATEMGLDREQNEDQFLIAHVAKSMNIVQSSLALNSQIQLFGEAQETLLMVADGMGGHAAGERASELVVDGITDYVLNQLRWFLQDKARDSQEFQQELLNALLSCHRLLLRDVEKNPQRRGMGSTVTLAYIVWPRMFLLHVGDCRCYLLRGNHLEQLTNDHNLANLAEQARSNDLATGKTLERSEVDENTTEDRPTAHILWNVISANDQPPHPDVSCIELQVGDTLLLCTDGLYQQMSRRTLKEMLQHEEGVECIMGQLVAEAKQRSTDDITGIVCRFNSFAASDAEGMWAHAIAPELADTAEFLEPPAALYPLQSAPNSELPSLPHNMN